ncbi:AbrB/MazE/SpoVT family DNA-binding domain-containing protein [Prosthecobacter sp. SYSU 5D2]|uniref:AbrB/MazE/SpoVT family DNA-binding domain-containing protein n=1 Tax=Prosthecobacter sp. SYSU 5D2 TaxID=3134134 RepID=UPI0031FE8F60
MTITAKGQVTIPQFLRNRYRLRPGSHVDIIPQEDGLHLVPQKTLPTQGEVNDWLSKATGSAATTLTTDELMTLTRGED